MMSIWDETLGLLLCWETSTGARMNTTKLKLTTNYYGLALQRLRHPLALPLA